MGSYFKHSITVLYIPERQLVIRSFLRPLVNYYYGSGGYYVVGTNKDENTSLLSQFGHTGQLEKPSRVSDSFKIVHWPACTHGYCMWVGLHLIYTPTNT